MVEIKKKNSHSKRPVRIRYFLKIIHIHFYIIVCFIICHFAQDLLADIDTKQAKAIKEEENMAKGKATVSSSTPEEKTTSSDTSPSKPKGGRRLVIQEVEGSDSEDDQWEDAKEEVAKDTKVSTKTDGSDLVNGIDSTKRKADEIGSPTSSVDESKVPHQKKHDPDVIRNIPYEETQPVKNGKPDESDGGCVSRPAQVVEDEHKKHESENSKPAEETPSSNVAPESAHVNGVKDVITTEASTEETTSVPPPAPRVERSLPSDVVRVKDKALELYKAGQYGEARDKFTQAINKLLPGKSRQYYEICS